MQCPQSIDPDETGNTDSRTTTERFLDFHAANPQVYITLRELARDWIAASKKKCGIELLWNCCRWHLSMEIVGDEAFELNNNFKSFYARALMHFEPELAGMFDLRVSPEADAWIAQYKGQHDGQAA